MVCYPGVSRFSPAQDEEDGNKGMMGCWLCLPKPWFCFFFPRPFRVSLSWSLSLSTPYLFPCLFFFVPVLWEETRKTVSILVRPSPPSLFLSSSPRVLCFLWLYSHRIPPLPGNKSTVIAGVMVAVGSWGAEEDEQCWETAPFFCVLILHILHFCSPVLG